MIPYTWNTAPIGHVVPGSGVIIRKSPHLGGWHVTFRRDEGQFAGEEWTRYALGTERVPVALTSHGLVYR